MAKKILVVEDEAIILKVLKSRLTNCGYTILIAEDGEAAYKLIKEQKPDLVLLDLRLPIMDGEEVCRLVRRDEKLRHIPIILLTAGDKIENLEVTDFITKPFDFKELLDKIKKILG